jgi:hypothetical protein
MSINLIEIVRTETKKVNDYRVFEETIKAGDEQKKINEQFRLLVKELDEEIKAYVFAVKNLSFTRSPEIMEKISDLADYCDGALKGKVINVTENKNIRNSLKDVEEAISETWKPFYEQQTCSLIEMIRLSRNIAGMNVVAIESGISQCEAWTTDIDKLSKYSESVKMARDLVNKLNLSDNIVEFLKKMMSRSAKLSDIDDNILDWIHKENLGDRIKISF